MKLIIYNNYENYNDSKIIFFQKTIIMITVIIYFKVLFFENYNKYK